MRHLRTIELGPFPLAAALSLIVLIPCAAVIQLSESITTPGAAVAVLVVGVLGTYSVATLYAWAGMFAAEWSLELLGRLAASRRPAPAAQPGEASATA